MQYQTTVPVDPGSPKISYESELVLLGSCFVEHMGNKLEHFNFRSHTNPFGVIFNPWSQAALLERAVNGRLFTAEDAFFANGRWHSFEVHSRCSHPDKEQFIEGLNHGVITLQQKLRSATHVVFTYGTSWVYRHLEADRIAANCHKQPQRYFEKELLDVEEIVLQLEKADHLIKSVNAACSVIATVSPVRHIKDGMVENQRSKAHLITALHNFLERTPSWHYFPSYELVMDELRDYRFYADDMIHPSGMAVEVVWSRFQEAWIDQEVKGVMKSVDRIRKALQHRPFDPDGEAHQQFMEKVEKEKRQLLEKYPFMTF